MPKEVGEADATHGLDAVQFVAPDLFSRGATGKFPPGAVIISSDLDYSLNATIPVLMIWISIRRRVENPQEKLLIAAVVLADSAFLLAMGDAGGLHRIQRMLPLANGFHTPARHGMLAHLALAVAAAVASDALLRGPIREQLWPKRGEPAFWVAPSFVVIAIAICMIAHEPLNLPLFGSRSAIAAGPILILIAVFCLILSGRCRQVGMIALVAFTLLDQSVYGLAHPCGHGSETLNEIRAGYETPPGYRQAEKDWLRSFFVSSVSTLDGVRMMLSMTGLLPTHFARIGEARSPTERANARQFARLIPAPWMPPGPMDAWRRQRLDSRTDAARANVDPGSDGG